MFVYLKCFHVFACTLFFGVSALFVVFVFECTCVCTCVYLFVFVSVIMIMSVFVSVCLRDCVDYVGVIIAEHGNKMYKIFATRF